MQELIAIIYAFSQGRNMKITYFNGCSIYLALLAKQWASLSSLMNLNFFLSGFEMYECFGGAITTNKEGNSETSTRRQNYKKIEF